MKPASSFARLYSTPNASCKSLSQTIIVAMSILLLGALSLDWTLWGALVCALLLYVAIAW